MDVTKKSLKKIGQSLVLALRKQLSSMGKGSSSLSKGISYKIVGDSVSIIMPSYGEFLDKGTKPHMPPVDAIRPWADKKGIDPWALAKSIEQKGTEPQPFLFVLDNTEPRIFDEFTRSVEKEITIKTDSIFAKYYKK